MTTLRISIPHGDLVLKAEVVVHQPAPWDSDELEFYVDAAHFEGPAGKVRDLTDTEIAVLDAEENEAFNLAVGEAWADHDPTP